MPLTEIMAKKNKFKIEVQCEKLDKGAMFMHTQLASGEYDGTKFTIDQGLPGGSIVLNVGEFKEGHRYRIGIQEITKALLDFHFAKGKKIKVAEIPTIPNPKK